ncbi:MAG: hypothetical protein KBC84_09540 [Proteobacteria bacterium]|nr:hypothetical protein [Pseudomonadota bacterium]
MIKSKNQPNNLSNTVLSKLIQQENFLEDKHKSKSPASEQATFDPSVSELNTTWSTYAHHIICLNTYPNGITISVHNNLKDKSDSEREEKKYSADQFHLRLRDTRSYLQPEGKYYLYKENYRSALETHLSRLQRSSMLGNTVLYFGTVTDPFLALHKKFDITMACLDLLQKYIPSRVVFQTRSPMVISILPTLKFLGDKSMVVIPIETTSEKAIVRYTPGMPRIGERLIAADGLRKQGIPVNLSASPLLPYGDPKRDAWDMAELLASKANYITFGCLASGIENEEKQLKILPLAQKLAADQQYFWLRPHCYQYLYQAVKSIAPEKLQLSVKPQAIPSQLKLFAA